VIVLQRGGSALYTYHSSLLYLDLGISPRKMRMKMVDGHVVLFSVYEEEDRSVDGCAGGA
jgi:hypothetical protein